MEIEIVNEETPEGNFVIEVYNKVSEKWSYIITEFSFSVAVSVAINLHIGTDNKVRVLSRRNNNQIMFES